MTDQSPSTASRLQGYQRDRLLQINAVLVGVLFAVGVSGAVTMDAAPGMLLNSVAGWCYRISLGLPADGQYACAGQMQIGVLG